MKTGDLVLRVDNWIKANPWMGCLTQYGIIIHAPEKTIYNSSITVLWSTLGLMKEHPDDIEVINDD